VCLNVGSPPNWQKIPPAKLLNRQDAATGDDGFITTSPALGAVFPEQAASNLVFAFALKLLILSEPPFPLLMAPDARKAFEVWQMLWEEKELSDLMKQRAQEEAYMVANGSWKDYLRAEVSL